MADSNESISPYFYSIKILMTFTRQTFRNIFNHLNPWPTAISKSMEKNPKLSHHVFFWLKNPNSKADRDKLIAGLRQLAKIETIVSLQIGIPAETEKRPVVDNSFSVSELMFFHDVDGQNIYQTHPIHLKFIDECSALWEKVLVYDAVDA